MFYSRNNNPFSVGDTGDVRAMAAQIKDNMQRDDRTGPYAQSVKMPEIPVGAGLSGEICQLVGKQYPGVELPQSPLIMARELVKGSSANVVDILQQLHDALAVNVDGISRHALNVLLLTSGDIPANNYPTQRALVRSLQAEAEALAKSPVTISAAQDMQDDVLVPACPELSVHICDRVADMLELGGTEPSTRTFLLAGKFAEQAHGCTRKDVLQSMFEIASHPKSQQAQLLRDTLAWDPAKMKPAQANRYFNDVFRMASELQGEVRPAVGACPQLNCTISDRVADVFGVDRQHAWELVGKWSRDRSRTEVLRGMWEIARRPDSDEGARLRSKLSRDPDEIGQFDADWCGGDVIKMADKLRTAEGSDMASEHTSPYAHETINQREARLAIASDVEKAAKGQSNTDDRKPLSDYLLKRLGMGGLKQSPAELAEAIGWHSSHYPGAVLAAMIRAVELGGDGMHTVIGILANGVGNLDSSGKCALANTICELDKPKPEPAAKLSRLSKAAVDALVSRIDDKQTLLLADLTQLSDYLVGQIGVVLPQPPLVLVREFVRVSDRWSAESLAEMVKALHDGRTPRSLLVELLSIDVTTLTRSRAQYLADHVFNLRGFGKLADKTRDDSRARVAKAQESESQIEAILDRCAKSVATSEELGTLSDYILTDLDDSYPQAPVLLARRLATYSDHKWTWDIMPEMIAAMRQGGSARDGLKMLLHTDISTLDSAQARDKCDTLFALRANGIGATLAASPEIGDKVSIGAEPEPDGFRGLQAAADKAMIAQASIDLELASERILRVLPGDLVLPQTPAAMVVKLSGHSTQTTRELAHQIYSAAVMGGVSEHRVTVLLRENADLLSPRRCQLLAESLLHFVTAPETRDERARERERWGADVEGAFGPEYDRVSNEIAGVMSKVYPQTARAMAAKLSAHTMSSTGRLLEEMLAVANQGGRAKEMLDGLLVLNCEAFEDDTARTFAGNLLKYRSVGGVNDETAARLDEEAAERLRAESLASRNLQALGCSYDETSNDIVRQLGLTVLLRQTPREMAEKLARHTMHATAPLLREMLATAKQGGTAAELLLDLLRLDAGTIDGIEAGRLSGNLMLFRDLGTQSTAAAADAAYRLDEKTAADMGAARLDDKEIDKAAAGLGYNKIRDRMRAHADEGATVDIDAQFPLQIDGRQMKYQAHATGFKEANTGRQLYLRVNGSLGNPRFAIFDGLGNYMMDVDRTALDQIQDHVRSASTAVSDGSYSDYLKTVGRPELGHGIADTEKLYPGMLLDEGQIMALSEAEVGVACSIEGVAINRNNAAVSRTRLQEHFAAKRQLVPSDIAATVALLHKTVDRQREELRVLSSASVASSQSSGEAKRLAEEWLREREGLESRVSRAQGRADSMEVEERSLQGRLDTQVRAASGYQNELSISRARATTLNEALKDALGAEQQALGKADGAEAEAVALRATNIELTEANNEFAQLALEAAPNENDKIMDDTNTTQAVPAVMPEAGALAPQPSAGNQVMAMFTDALALAAVQQSSKLMVSKLTPIMIRAGVPKAFAENEQVRGILELVLPFILSQYGDQIPGIKKMTALPALSQTQMVMGLAGVIGVSVQQLLGIGIEVIGSLNSGVGEDELQAAKDLLDSDAVNQPKAEPAAAKTGPQAV